jgi:hypothetical protein
MGHAKYSKYVFWFSAALILTAILSRAERAAAAENFLRSLVTMARTFQISGNVDVTDCDMEGAPVNGDQRANLPSRVKYHRGANSVSITLQMGSKATYAFFTTRDRTARFPGDFRIGDPITSAIRPGVIEGEFSSSDRNGMKFHEWTGDVCTILITERDGIINEVGFVDREAIQKFRVNAGLTGYVAQGAAAPPETEAARTASPTTRQDSPAIDTSVEADSRTIDDYPLSPSDKNVLGIRHRSARNLYSQKKYAEAFAIFSELANAYDFDYLSSYWAGASKAALEEKDEARAWFERTLAINPAYRPAKDAMAR